MDNRCSSAADSKLLEKAVDILVDRIWCEACGTDQFVLLERALRRRRHGGGFWDVDYFCARCGNSYGHLVRDVEVTPALMRAMTAAKV